MKKILHIDSSARPGLGGIDLHGSYSRRLSHEFMKYWLSQKPDTEVRYRDLGQQPPDHITHLWIEAALGTSLEPAEVTCVLEKSNEFVDELMWADVLVLGVPMYNFGMPSSLKAWIDHIVLLERTFIYTLGVQEHPFVGIFSERSLPVILLSSRGDHGMDPGEEYAHMNHLDPAIKTALGFIGIKEFYSISVEHQSEGGEALSHSLQKALSSTHILVDSLLTTHVVNMQ